MDSNLKMRTAAQGDSSTEKNTDARDDGYSVDVKKLREDAKRHLERGAITPSYTANRELVLKLLNEALATELVCVLRYKRHQFVARWDPLESTCRHASLSIL